MDVDATMDKFIKENQTLSRIEIYCDMNKELSNFIKSIANLWVKKYTQESKQTVSAAQENPDPTMSYYVVHE